MAKTLFKINPLLLQRLRDRLDSIGMVRDKFLDRILAHEAGMLDEEIEQPNSLEARKYIAEGLEWLSLKPVNLALSAGTISRVNEVCTAKNIPRDAFVNRVILLLVAKQPKLYERLYPWREVFATTFETLWLDGFLDRGGLTTQSGGYMASDVGGALAGGMASLGQLAWRRPIPALHEHHVMRQHSLLKYNPTTSPM